MTREEDDDDCSARFCGSPTCAVAMAGKSTTGGLLEISELVSVRDSASATALFLPWT